MNTKAITDYGWTVAKMLNAHAFKVMPLTARQLLADCFKLPIERPSKLHSALLSAAIKVAELSTDLHFVPFLQMWDLHNLRPEDFVRPEANSTKSSTASDRATASGASVTIKKFPSLAERVVRLYVQAKLNRPEEDLSDDQFQLLLPTMKARGYLLYENPAAGTSSPSIITPMLVTRTKEAVSKEGRKYVFITLTSPQGLEVECISKQLKINPLHPLPEGKSHYVNIGQLYDCILRKKDTPAEESQTAKASTASQSAPTTSYVNVYQLEAEVNQQETSTSKKQTTLAAAYLSQKKARDIFPIEVGYVEHIDTSHGHMHIYDRFSRHFVANILRFSREQQGDFVHFLPVIPTDSKFKTAIILGKAPIPEATADGLIRPIRITSINREKNFANWQLVDESHPIQEQLTPYQIAHGELPSSYTQGYLPLNFLCDVEQDDAATFLPSRSVIYAALIYLHRGKDKIKRPRVARISKL